MYDDSFMQVAFKQCKIVPAMHQPQLNFDPSEFFLVTL